MVRKKHHSSCPIIQKKIEKKIARCWCGSTMFYPFFGGLVFHSVLEFADVSWFLHLFFWSLLFFMAFGSLFLILLNSSRLKLCLSEVWWAHSFPQQRGHVFRTPVRRSGLLAASLYRSTEVTEVGDFLKRHFWLCLSERRKVPRFRPFLWPRVEKRYVGFVTLKGQAQIVADARCEFERPFQRQHEVACWSGPLWLNLISDGVGKLRSDKTVNSTLTPPPQSIMENWSETIILFLSEASWNLPPSPRKPSAAHFSSAEFLHCNKIHLSSCWQQYSIVQYGCLRSYTFNIFQHSPGEPLRTRFFG